jgi:hypothetical protein
VRILPTFDSSHAAADAHWFGSRGDGRFEMPDCVHYCQPSAAMDLMADTLFTMHCPSDADGVRF